MSCICHCTLSRELLNYWKGDVSFRKKQRSVDERSRSVYQWSLGTDSTFQLSAWHRFVACSERKDPNPVFCSSIISLYDFQTKWCDYLNLELSLLYLIKPSLVGVMLTFRHKGVSEISLLVVGWWRSTSFFASYSPSPVLCCAGTGLNPCQIYVQGSRPIDCL